MHEERASHPAKLWTNSWSTSQDGLGLVCFTAIANGTRDTTWTTLRNLCLPSHLLWSLLSCTSLPSTSTSTHPHSSSLSSNLHRKWFISQCTSLSLLHSTSELHKWLSQQGTTASVPSTSLLSFESWLILSSILTFASLAWKSWSSADTFESQSLVAFS